MVSHFHKIKNHKSFRPLLIFSLVLIVIGLGIWFRSKSHDSQVLDLDYKPKVLETKAEYVAKDIKEEKVYSLPSDHEGFNDLFFFTSPDGQKIAYAISKGSGWAVVVNGQVGEAYDSLSAVSFSPDSEHFAYTAKKNNQEIIVVDHQAGPSFDWTFEPKTFTPDSRFFIYKAKKDGKDIMMVNNWASRPYDEIYKANVSPDGSQLFLFARQDKELWRISIDLDKSKELK